ncbi:hypothetical protein MIR68_008178 [Amoeboaphelidium protococcarum]|nr:hypothetical protein MIR68_008178 [Amoeboaphelidium protococcarum]
MLKLSQLLFGGSIVHRLVVSSIPIAKYLALQGLVVMTPALFHLAIATVAALLTHVAPFIILNAYSLYQRYRGSDSKALTLWERAELYRSNLMLLLGWWAFITYKLFQWTRWCGELGINVAMPALSFGAIMMPSLNALNLASTQTYSADDLQMCRDSNITMISSICMLISFIYELIVIRKYM